MQTKPRMIFIALIMALTVSMLNPYRANAAPIQVNVAYDEYDESNNNCTLREAIIAANQNRRVGGCPAGSSAEMDVIFLQPITYYLSEFEKGSDDNSSKMGDLDITDSLTILGDPSGKTIIEVTTLKDRIFHISTTGSVIFRYLTIKNGEATGLASNPHTGRGGGIFNERGTVTIDRCIIIGNQGPTAGGGIENNLGAFMSISDSIIQNNTSKYGGGIFNDGQITIKNSLIHANEGKLHGGGFVNNDNLSKGTLINVTISANQSPNGFGIFSQSNIEITNNTIVDNIKLGTIPGAAIYIVAKGFIVNSIIARHVANCSVSTTSFFSKGNNLVDNNDCPFNATGEKSNTFPGLSTNLALNGGRTQNYALLEGSEAINAASNAYCPSYDQRSLFFSRTDGACDIGSFEFGAVETVLSVYLPTIRR